MATETFANLTDRIRTLFEERMRIRGASLQTQVYKAGPRLPRRVRNAADAVVKAEVMTQNPKLARMIDETALAAQAGTVIAHLESIDPWDELKGKVLKVLGWVSAILIALFIAGVWYGVKTGRF